MLAVNSYAEKVNSYAGGDLGEKLPRGRGLPPSPPPATPGFVAEGEN